MLVPGLLLWGGCEQARQKATREAMKTMMPKKEQVELEESEKFHAVVSDEMTLAQVADTNDISILLLKKMLGIPHYVDHPYSILQLSRNYKFTVADLKRIIEAQKDRQTANRKKAAEKEKNKSNQKVQP